MKKEEKELFLSDNKKGFFSEHTSKLGRKDFIIISIFVIINLILSFYNLGVLENPDTYYHFTSVDESVEIELANGNQNISKIRYYNGVETGKFTLMISTDGKKYQELATLDQNSVFAWEDLNIDSNFKYLRFVSKNDNSYLGEVQLYNTYGEKVLAKAKTEESIVLIDEMDTVPAQLSYMNSTYFDEIYFARSAYEYIHGIDAMEWVHPPLGKLIMMIPILLFGMSTFSYRLMGALAGIIMIPVIYILAKRMFKNSKWAILAGVIMTFDCFRFAQTRMGTVDSFLVLFIMLSALFMYQYIDLDKDASLKKKLLNLFFSGLFIGCSISIKWTGLYAGLALAIIFFGNLIYRNLIKKEKDQDLIKIILACCIFFVVIPITIYILGYLLFPNVVNYHTNNISGIIQQIKDMYYYHSSLTETHPFSSDWYSWPIMHKPVWYYVGYYGGNIKSTIVGIGNPVIWWFGILAFVFVLISSLIKRKKEMLLILVFVLCCFLPYVFIGRDMFMYHYFPTLPFIMLAIVAFIKWITEKINSHYFYIIYVILVVLVFILFYPVISGRLTTTDYIDSLKWLSSWIF